MTFVIFGRTRSTKFHCALSDKDIIIQRTVINCLMVSINIYCIILFVYCYIVPLFKSAIEYIASSIALQRREKS